MIKNSPSNISQDMLLLYSYHQNSPAFLVSPGVDGLESMW